jgi:integration host factor subunit beta
MTKADLVERVTAQISRTAGPMISKKDCARVVDSFLDAIKEALQEQKNIEVRGFGTFKIRHRKTRMARNPRTGSPVEVSARPVPVFKPSKELRAMVANIDLADLEDEEEELSEAYPLLGLTLAPRHHAGASLFGVIPNRAAMP